ncbi:MAG: ABC transporter ATP-binding protein [Burkholderiaceae bacterium]|nr:ABC transporter ATP-binding protein [Burkholderiaceae bacterium]
MSGEPSGGYAVEMLGITKRFGTVLANDQIELKIAAGTIHGVVGENGAGKSTLMSILYGFYQADEGEIRLQGKPVQIRSSTEAIAQGVGMVHQHFMLVEPLSALENILLGAEDGWLLAKARQKAEARLKTLMETHHLPVDLHKLVEAMPVGEQQRLEILKALFRRARILILDEPTGVLTPQEAAQLFTILRELRAQGVTVVLITHKLQEIMDVTDNVTVMRAGRVVAQRRTQDTSREELAELMIGRPVLLQVDKGAKPAADSAVRLAVKNLRYHDARGVERLKGLEFELRAGEILGIAGVSGNGQTELLAVLAGLLKPSAGELQLNTRGAQRRFDARQWLPASELRAFGCGHVPEDRLGEGVIKNFSMQESAILGFHQDAELGGWAWLSPKRIRERTLRLIEAFDVRPVLPSLRTADMSGGNQQKLVIAREMARQPEVLLVGQPTRGVDLGAIERIYRELIKARDAGAAILLVSVELEEIFALTDRIMVMNGGGITGIVETAQSSAKDIGMLMTAERAAA